MPKKVLFEDIKLHDILERLKTNPFFQVSIVLPHLFCFCYPVFGIFG